MTEVRIGRLVLHPHRQLLAGGERVQLGKRALDILSVLAEANGDIVTKDELLEQVWPNVVVEENALQVHIVALRKALGQEADRLETIRAVGYRLAIDSSSVPAEASTEPAKALGEAIQVRRGVSRRSALVVAGLGFVTLGAGWAAWNYRGLVLGGADTNSVAVLPFKNLNGDSEQDYFSDGLAEELRTTLSLNRRLEVAARTSSDAFRDSQDSIEEIARKLDVAFVLEGSVRRSLEEGIRVTARLIDSATGFESWSEIFQGADEDVIEVQRQIAAQVADALTSTIVGEDAASPERIGGTSNSRAFDAYLRGVALYELAQGEATDRAALADFDRAIEIDPSYAAAHAARSRALTVIGNSYGKGGRDYYGRAIAAARKAIELSPDMAEGHAALGLGLTNGRLDIAGARDPYQRSFDLGYGNANILRGFADFAAHTGRFDEGRQAIERAERLDPLNFLVFRSGAIVEFEARDFRAAESKVRGGLALNPKGSGLHRILGDIALLENRDEDAKRHFLDEPSAISRLRGLAIADARLFGEKAGQAQLDKMIEEFGANSLYQQAEVLAQWSRPDEAISALEQALDAGDAGLVLAFSDPLLDPVRQDSRFSVILTRLGFAQT